LLLLDLNRCKEVNDTLGHHIGDGLLAAVAKRLRGAVRQDDMAGRLGGDEFAIVLAAADVEGETDAADRLAGIEGIGELVDLDPPEEPPSR